MSDLLGRIAAVTASTDGIGFAIARKLAHKGAKVIISSRNEDNVNKAVLKLKKEGFDVQGVVCHVSNPQHRRLLFEKARLMGGLDILVSNAGTNPVIGGVLDCDEKAWDKIFEINVKSAFMLAREALPLLRKSKNARIIFVSSIAGLVPLEVLGVYSVTKTALIGLTKAAALQLAADNITVNCVAPGIITTKFSNLLTTNEALKSTLLLNIPLRRFGTVEESAGIVGFLCSDEASYITGETIVVSGGMTSRL